jgi:hypothetical protein
LLPILFIMACLVASGQDKKLSIGVFTGFSAPFTWDEGIYADPRYTGRNQIKPLPIGIALDIDRVGYGFAVAPAVIMIGQNFYMVNAVGVHEGSRKINMQYVQLPLSLKLHVIDMEFFRISLAFGLGAGYLLRARETIEHKEAVYRFPTDTYPFLPNNYVIEFTGVRAPLLPQQTLADQSDFNRFQIFSSVGFRSDWDFNKAWRLTIDARANYSALETRKSSYLAGLETHRRIYELSGKRREIFASVTVGIARYRVIESKAKKLKVKKKSPGKRKR